MASAEELGERGPVRAIITIRYCQRSPQFLRNSFSSSSSNFVTQSVALRLLSLSLFISTLRSPLSLGDMLGAADEQRAALLLRLSCATCSNCLRSEQVETRDEYEKTQSQFLRANFHASKCFPAQKRRKIDAASIREYGESKMKREKWLRHKKTPTKRQNLCENRCKPQLRQCEKVSRQQTC